MSKFSLAFGIHNHQPVGNFTAVFEEAHQRAYRPFLDLVREYGNVRMSLHQSGILWDWQKRVHPEYFELVGDLADSGQVELMTGGFFEPILTAIPQRDALGQLEMLNEFLESHFEKKPEGLWLTERIWEPHLPTILAQAGVKYLPIDDTHFIYAGFEHSQLTGPFVTENEGKTVTLLPIQKRLRYLIPFGTVEEVIGELRAQAERDPDGMAVYADDGEKFGVWPNTYKHCYGDGWLRRFFEAVIANADWLQIVPLAQAAKAAPVGRAYLPTASYEEMLHWSLPPAAFVEYEAFEKWLKEQGQLQRWGRFVRGGHWRGFLAKYEESNLMHKKMLWVSEELARCDVAGDQDIKAAREQLYASQCNCPYWHGVFGGLYLPHIRQAVYAKMIEAHARLRKLTRAGVSFTEQDYDKDGRPELIFDSDIYTAVLKPDRGGTLIELCMNQTNFNLTDTLTRRREGYHLKLDKAVSAQQNGSHASIHDLVLAKEDGLRDLLVEDWYLKRCFIDHFLDNGVDFEDFRGGKFQEHGDFVLEAYRPSLVPESNQVTLTRDGFVRRPDGQYPVRVEKTFVFYPKEHRLEVRYQLSSRHPGGAQVQFAVENNFNFQAGHAIDRYVMIDGRRPEHSYLDSKGESRHAHNAALVDEYRGLAVLLESSQAASIWRMPIWTVSLSEGGFEKVYQGTTLVHKYDLRLNEQPLSLSINLRAGALRQVLPNIPAEIHAG